MSRPGLALAASPYVADVLSSEASLPLKFHLLVYFIHVLEMPDGAREQGQGSSSVRNVVETPALLVKHRQTLSQDGPF